AVPDPFYVFDLWDGSALSLDNPLSLTVSSDVHPIAEFRPRVFTDDFEAGDLMRIDWVSGGTKPWSVQTNVVAAGRFAAMSGPITSLQTSSLTLTANFRSGNGAFDYRVSSQPAFDVLTLLVDGSDVREWSGEVGA